MPLLSNHATRVALQKCILKQQGRCYICGKEKYPLILEHKDGDRTNNPPDGSNWGAACISCNTKKGKNSPQNAKKHSAERECERESEREFQNDLEIEDLVKSGELLKSERFKPRVRRWIIDIINDEKSPEVSRILNGAAEKFSLSQTTIKRWLDAMTSPEGNYEYTLNDNGKKCIKKKGKNR